MTLEERIDNYGKVKELADSYKKNADAQNKDLKKYLEEHDIKDYSTDSYVVKYYTQTKESMNEPKAIDILKHAGITKCIKTVEILDADALENLLYNGEIPVEVIVDLQTCREVKVVPALKISKVKGAKND